jgi:hypothetical protein
MPTKRDDDELERLRRLCEQADDIGRSASRLRNALTERMKEIRSGHRIERHRPPRRKNR